MKSRRCGVLVETCAIIGVRIGTNSTDCSGLLLAAFLRPGEAAPGELGKASLRSPGGGCVTHSHGDYQRRFRMSDLLTFRVGGPSPLALSWRSGAIWVSFCDSHVFLLIWGIRMSSGLQAAGNRNEYPKDDHA